MKKESEENEENEESDEIIPKHCIRKEIGGSYDSADKNAKNFKLCLEIKVRNNSKISRRDLLKSVLAALQSLAPGVDFDYNDTTNMFKVDLMKTVCCFSLMKSYNAFKKYNMMEHRLAVKKLKDGESDKVENDKVENDKIKSEKVENDETESEKVENGKILAEVDTNGEKCE